MELCRRACMHVCHLTYALLCLSRDWCIRVCVGVVRACVCIQVVSVRTYMKQQAQNWMMLFFLLLFQPQPEVSSFVLSPGSFQTTHTSNVTALCVKSGVIAPF